MRCGRARCGVDQLDSVGKYQRLRSLFKPLQSWKYDGTTLATELVLEFVDREASVRAFPLQDTKGHHTARDVVHLRLLGAHLTARSTELLLTDADDFLDLGTYPVQLPHLHGGQRQAIGGVVLVAVSDNQDFEAAAQPADLGPVRVSPMLPHRVASEPAMLFQTPDNIPSVVATPFQERSRRVPRIKQDVRRATAQAMAGLAE
jgi:hypothetical protein